MLRLFRKRKYFALGRPLVAQDVEGAKEEAMEAWSPRYRKGICIRGRNGRVVSSRHYCWSGGNSWYLTDWRRG